MDVLIRKAERELKVYCLYIVYELMKDEPRVKDAVLCW